ncbi:MAG: NfeD family protein [bacterium]
MERIFSVHRFPALVLSLILFLTLFSLRASNSVAVIGQGGDKGRNRQDEVFLVKLSGEVDQGLSPFIRRVVRQADEQGIRAIILEINTLGGRLDAAIDIRDTLLNSKTLTIAYINERAISAGALISLACQKIVMAPGATIGAATPVIIDPFSQKGEPASEKVISYFRKEMKATAEKNHRPSRIAEAMVDPDVVIEGLTEKGKLLTLTTSEALRSKVADFEITGGTGEILQKFNLHLPMQARLVEQRANWAEKFLRATSGSLISSVLLTIGLLGLLIELRTPTWGIAGTVGLICLAVFFWGHVILRLVGWEEVALLLIGTVLLLLEILVIPGFGLTGILGLAALAAGFILSLVGRNPTSWELWSAVSHISIVMLIALIALALSVKFLAKSAAVQRLVLQTRTGQGRQREAEQPKTDTAAPEEARPALKSDQEPDRVQHLDQSGVALTNLRPAGKAAFGKKRLNVVSEGDFIDRGSAVRIVRVEGSRIMVQKIGKEERV